AGKTAGNFCSSFIRTRLLSCEFLRVLVYRSTETRSGRFTNAGLSDRVCTSDVLSGLNQGMQPRHRSKSSSVLQFPPAKEAAGSFRLRDSSPNLRGHRE